MKNEDWQTVKRDYVRRLERRADHLAARIAGKPATELSYDRAELAALLWAVPTLRANDATLTEKVTK